MFDKKARMAVTICFLVLILASPSLVRNSAHATPGSSPNFTLAISQSGLVQLKAGHGFVLDATITAENGFNGTVTVTVSGLPSGVTVIADDSQATVVGSGTAELEIDSDRAEAMIGQTTTVTVTATSGSLSHTASFQMKMLGD